MAEEAPSNRFGLVANLQSRDGTLDKGALVTNAFGEQVGGKMLLTPRPGLGSFSALDTATFTLAAGGMAVSMGSGADPIIYALKNKVFYSMRSVYLPSIDTGWKTWPGPVTAGAPVLGSGTGQSLGQALSTTSIYWA